MLPHLVTRSQSAHRDAVPALLRQLTVEETQQVVNYGLGLLAVDSVVDVSWGVAFLAHNGNGQTDNRT